MIYKFSPNAKADYSDIENSQVFKLHERLEKLDGNVSKLNVEEKEYLKVVFDELWHPDAYRTGIYKLMGYCIDFSQWMKKYWVKQKHYGIREMRAFNKTMIRQNSCSPSYILKIVEV